MLQIAARQRLTTTCTLNLYNFPFDRQKCTITFSAMNTDGKSGQQAKTTTEVRKEASSICLVLIPNQIKAYDSGH